jgi:hypothetical protein
VPDALIGDDAGPADEAKDRVSLLEQELGKIAAVLAGEAGDQRVGHTIPPYTLGPKSIASN